MANFFQFRLTQWRRRMKDSFRSDECSAWFFCFYDDLKVAFYNMLMWTSSIMIYLLSVTRWLLAERLQFFFCGAEELTEGRAKSYNNMNDDDDQASRTGQGPSIIVFANSRQSSSLKFELSRVNRNRKRFRSTACLVEFPILALVLVRSIVAPFQCSSSSFSGVACRASANT